MLGRRRQCGFLAALVIGALGALGAAGCSSAVATGTVTIRIDHPAALADTPLSIEVRGLQPGARVTMRASSVLLDRSVGSSATFVADSHGDISLASSKPMSGSYSTVDPMGLFWSMTSTGAASVPGPIGRFVVTLSVDDASGHQLATARVTRLLNAPGETHESLALSEHGFLGRLFLPPKQARGPGVVVFGGSEGGFGASPTTASMLAAHGIPALALAYFGAPGLPATLTDIPLEYFANAARWFSTQAEVDPAKVWLLSGSRGSEAALLVAAHFPGLIHGVVAQAPSSLVYGGLPSGSAWILQGRALPHAIAGFSATQYAEGAVVERPAFVAGLGGPATAAATIPVEDIRGPVLLINGDDDQLWPSDIYAGQIIARLDAHHDSWPHERLSYPGAGHIVLSFPYGPAPPAIESLARRPRLLIGGSPQADNAAYVVDWPKTLAFISSN